MQHRNKTNHHPDSLKPFFEPGSVAVIGASRTAGKGGHNIIENLLRLGYPGAIYPVNPQAKKIMGLAVYPNLQNIPEPPELGIIVLPPAQVPEAVEDCIARGTRAVIIESAGFAETDEAGARAQEGIARRAAETGIRVMGPNSVGTIDTAARFDSSFGQLNEIFLPNQQITPGHTGFIGQTGLFTGVFLPLLNSEMGVSKIACLGNKCDVDESDVLEYYGQDPATKVIAMYLESIKDGRRFLNLSRRITREKPIIVLKSGTTESGARVSASHTGSLTGEDRVYDAAFRQAGVIRAESFDRLWALTRAFVHAPLPPGNRVAIINLAGSGCVTAVDACVRNGLKVAELAPETVAAIKGVYPDWWQVRSPIDVWTAVEASGFEAAYTTTTRAALADADVDAVVVAMGAIDWLPGVSIPELFRDIKKAFPDKPLMAVNPLGDREVYHRTSLGFHALGIPCYTGAEEAIAALAALWRYRQYLGKTG
jgi:acetyltransferase